MVKYITLGNIDKSLLYIVFMSLSLVLNNYIYGYTYIKCFYRMNLYKTFYQLIIDSNETDENKFIRHRVFDPLFNYLGVAILSFFIIKKKIVNEFDNNPEPYNVNNPENNDDNDNENESDNNQNKIKLIFNNTKVHYYQSKEILFFIFILFLWVVVENLVLIYVDIFQDLDFWFFELIFVSIVFVKYFVFKISSHQKLGMAISILVGSILKIYNICITFASKPDTFYVKNPGVTPFALFYFVLIFLRSYVHIKIKIFLDLKQFSERFLLVSYGIAGTIICIFTGIFTSKVACPGVFYDHICKWKDNEGTIYYDNWDNYYVSGKNMLVRLIIIVLGLLAYFANKYYMILIIKNYTPIHVIFAFPIQFFIQKIFLLIFSALFFREQLFPESEQVKKFLLDESGDIGSIIGFLIYLEIIELNFCGFNFNLKKNIIERSKIDYIKSKISKILPFQEDFDDDSDDEENRCEKSNDNCNSNNNDDESVLTNTI